MVRPTRPALGLLVFDVPLPPLPLSPNKRHPSRAMLLRRSVASEAYKQAVLVDARNAVRAAGWQAPHRARVSLLFGLLRRRGNNAWMNATEYRPGDADNAVAAFKAGFDGLTLAGALVDDKWEHMVLGAVERAQNDGPWVRVSVEVLV